MKGQPMTININIQKFSRKFGEEYEFLYNAHCNGCEVAGEREALREGDEFIKNNPEFVREFCAYRGDFITSDREVMAFMFALSSMIG